MKNKVNIYKTGSWIKMDLEKQAEELNDVINDFVEENERIINIQLVQDNGYCYYLIYTTTL